MNAQAVARALCAAEADGHPAHGASRAPFYADQARSGKVDGMATPLVDRPAPAVVRVDARHGFAYPAVAAGLERAGEVAATAGVAAVSVANSHHLGMVAYHIEPLAARGLLALAFSNSPAAIAPWGGNAAVFGTNPIALAAPREHDPPLVIDLSMAQVARGKIMMAASRGEPIPGRLGARRRRQTDHRRGRGPRGHDDADGRKERGDPGPARRAARGRTDRFAVWSRGGLLLHRRRPPAGNRTPFCRVQSARVLIGPPRGPRGSARRGHSRAARHAAPRGRPVGYACEARGGKGCGLPGPSSTTCAAVPGRVAPHESPARADSGTDPSGRSGLRLSHRGPRARRRVSHQPGRAVDRAKRHLVSQDDRHIRHGHHLRPDVGGTRQDALRAPPRGPVPRDHRRAVRRDGRRLAPVRLGLDSRAHGSSADDRQLRDPGRRRVAERNRRHLCVGADRTAAPADPRRGNGRRRGRGQSRCASSHGPGADALQRGDPRRVHEAALVLPDHDRLPRDPDPLAVRARGPGRSTDGPRSTWPSSR